MINKTFWMLGYNGLAFITEQERKHWLLRTDKKKTLIDPVTRDQYVGQIDNLGSDVIIETHKKDSIAKALQDIQFNDNVDYVLSLEPSAFTYSCAVNGLLFARITSTNYPTDMNVDEYSEDDTLINPPEKRHFRIGFKNCKIVILPFGGSNDTEDVFAIKWIQSDEVYLELLDEDTNQYGVDDEHKIRLLLNDSTFRAYYPLASTLQPLPLELESNGYYHTCGITDDQMIGYPVFWLTCDETNVGPYITIPDAQNASTNGLQLWAFGNPGNQSIYDGKIYVGIDGSQNATPDESPTDEVYIECEPLQNMIFRNATSDFTEPVRNITIGGEPANFTYHGDLTEIRMSTNDGWEFVDQHKYRIKVSTFDQNCMSLGSNPLTSVFEIKFDKSLTNWISTTTDVGYAGLRANTGNPYSDMYRSYPHHLNKWDGIPEYMRNMEPNKIPEHMAIYALHNSPNYSEEIPDTRQTAALLFDLGEESLIDYDYKFYESGYSGEIPKEEETGVPEMYMEIVRFWDEASFLRKKPALMWDNYVKNNPRHDGESWADWQDRLKDNWTSETQAEYDIEYADYLYEYIICVYDSYVEKFAYSVYQDTSTRDSLQLDQTYIAIVLAEAETPHDTLTEEEYITVLKMMLNKANNAWHAYDKDAYVKYDNWFGVKVLDSSNVSDELIDQYKIVDCYDEKDGVERFVCKMVIGLYPNKEIKYMDMLLFGYHGDVYLSEKQWHIIHAYNAADDGTGTDSPEDWCLEFNLFLLDEVNDLGRVYVLSNDSTEYVNNKSTSDPKPDRTVARICDIPTSIVQLTGISGVAPVSIVDPKYVRTELSYTSLDKNRLHNETSIHWVRPNSARLLGYSNESDNDYVFTSVDDLNTVDMTVDEFRELKPFKDTNSFNVVVDPMVIEPGVIIENGEDYKPGDIGLIYIGGFALQYGVTGTNSSGGVASFTITPVKQGDLPSKQYPDIPLSNFDMLEMNNGYTATYGTSPLNGTGTGFKCSLFIPDINDYQLEYGDNYNDLFALMKHSDGLWLYEYNTTTSTWEKTMLLSRFESASIGDNFQTTTDAYMSFLLPTKQNLSVCQYYDHRKTIDNIAALCTSTFVNIIDQIRTPIQTDVTASTTDPTSITNEVDFCKFRCSGFKRYTASSRTWASAYATMLKAGILKQDCFIAFKWALNTTDDTNFYAGIIERSFNHILATNNFSMLPENTIPIQNGINSNPSTTIVWDVPRIGPMMWIFNPASLIHEKYHIDQQRQSFYIERVATTWEDIDIFPNSSLGKNDFTSLFDTDGKLLFDIYTNSPYMRNPSYDSSDSSIYRQPTFSKILSAGTLKDDIQVYERPTGNWECVFPRVDSFVFENDSERHIPIQMQAIHANNVITTSKLINEATEQDESSRTIIFEDTLTNGVRAKVFNSSTSTWDTI